MKVIRISFSFSSSMLKSSAGRSKLSASAGRSELLASGSTSGASESSLSTVALTSSLDSLAAGLETSYENLTYNWQCNYPSIMPTAPLNLSGTMAALLFSSFPGSSISSPLMRGPCRGDGHPHVQLLQFGQTRVIVAQ